MILELKQGVDPFVFIARLERMGFRPYDRATGG